MSLFNMLKRSVNKAVREAVESAVESRISPVIESAVDKFLKTEPDTVPEHSVRSGEDQATLYSHSGAPEDYFYGLLANAFPGCDVEKNVSANRLFPGAGVDALPCNLLISRMGKPVLLILLLPKNAYRLKRITQLKERCEAAGIAHMQFFLEFRNEASYVVDRVRKAL